MARDAIAITALSVNATTEEPAGVTITPANGGTVANPVKGRKLVLRVDHTTVSAKNLTVKAGANPPAFRQGLGDLVISLTASKKHMIPIETARFAQADGTINVDFETGMTGTIWAYKQPDGAA